MTLNMHRGALLSFRHQYPYCVSMQTAPTVSDTLTMEKYLIQPYLKNPKLFL